MTLCSLNYLSPHTVTLGLGLQRVNFRGTIQSVRVCHCVLTIWAHSAFLSEWRRAVETARNSRNSLSLPLDAPFSLLLPATSPSATPLLFPTQLSSFPSGLPDSSCLERGFLALALLLCIAKLVIHVTPLYSAFSDITSKCVRCMHLGLPTHLDCRYREKWTFCSSPPFSD